MERVRTLVVDDEMEAREGAAALLRRDPEIALVGECATGTEAIEAIARERPDLVLLDVQMPELDGFGVLDALDPASAPVVVFMTAYETYALRAFEARALDYLLKPFSDARFAAALEAAKSQVRQRRVGALGAQLAALLRPESPTVPAFGAAPAAADEHAVSGALPYLERILVRHERRILFVNVEHIDYISAADYYARIHVGDHTHLVRETMQDLERKLDPRRFVRVHRSAIVNIERMVAIEPYVKGGYVIRLRDKSRLLLSRSRRETLERALGQPI